MHKITTVLIISIIAIMLRTTNHLWNLSALGGLAIYCGSQFGVVRSILFTLSIRFSTDIYIGYYDSIFFDYSAYAIISIYANITKPESRSSIICTSLTASIIFFLISNFGSWVYFDTIYTRDINGIFLCYLMGLPFAIGTILGDSFFTIFSYLLSNILNERCVIGHENPHRRQSANDEARQLQEYMR